MCLLFMYVYLLEQMIWAIIWQGKFSTMGNSSSSQSDIKSDYFVRKRVETVVLSTERISSFVISSCKLSKSQWSVSVEEENFMSGRHK